MKQPKIRFKGFEGEWETHALSEYFKKVCNKNTKMECTTVLTNSAEYGIIPQNDFFDHAIANNKNIGGYYIVSPDDFVYNPRVSVTAPVGPINRSLLDFQGVMSPLYLVFKINAINKDYLNIFFKTNKWHKFMKLEGNCGARFDRLSISDEQFVKMPLTHPKDNFEQQSIAYYFKHLDSIIQSTTKKIESLKQVKAASLQAMFPQEGETTPSLRFKGFTEDWQLVTLGELFKERTERNRNGELLSVTMNNGIIKASENGRSDNSSEDKSNYKVVKVGDIAYNSMRMWQGASGCSQYEGIVSPAYTVIAPNENICSAFFSYYFKTSDVIKIFRLHSQGLTKDTWNLKYPMFSLIELYFPNNPIEQQKIADYFTNLDRQIALQEQRLEKLKQIKAACLENMFV